MNIAFYSDTYLPNRDGVVTAITTFRSELEKRGHTVYIFASGSSKAMRDNRDARVFLHRSAPFNPYPQYRIALFPFMQGGKARKLGINLVHSHGMATMGLAAETTARGLGVPVVGTFHTLIQSATHYIAGDMKVVKLTAEALAWKYLKWYYNRCDVCTAPSDVVKTMMQEHGISNVRTIPNGIDTLRFTPRASGAAVRKALGLEDKKIVMHLGRLVLEKNVDVLIRSALSVLEEEPDARFLIVGIGPAEAHYKELVRKARLEKYFTFRGLVPDAAVPQYYAAADVVAVPSTFETQGLVTLESMACGTPVAGADYLATKEIIRHGSNGFLFAPGDAEDCAEKIILALAAGKRVSANARKTAEKYSIENCTTRLLKLYEEELNL